MDNNPNRMPVTESHQVLTSASDASWRRAFTITELLIVITIIALLTGIVLTGGRAMLRGAEERRSRMLLQQLAGAETEFRAQTGDMIEVNPGNYGTLTHEGDPVDSIEYFMRRAWQVPEVRTLLQNIEDDYLVEDEDLVPIGVVDEWGERIEYRSQWDGSGTPPDGLPRAHPHPFFASRGSSGEFGDRYDLYSFDFE